MEEILQKITALYRPWYDRTIWKRKTEPEKLASYLFSQESEIKKLGERIEELESRCDCECHNMSSIYSCYKCERKHPPIIPIKEPTPEEIPRNSSRGIDSYVKRNEEPTPQKECQHIYTNGEPNPKCHKCRTPLRGDSPQKTDWEEEFNEKFIYGIKDINQINRIDIKDFISNLLSEKEKETREESGDSVETVRKNQAKCGCKVE